MNRWLTAIVIVCSCCSYVLAGTGEPSGHNKLLSAEYLVSSMANENRNGRITSGGALVIMSVGALGLGSVQKDSATAPSFYLASGVLAVLGFRQLSVKSSIEEEYENIANVYDSRQRESMAADILKREAEKARGGRYLSSAVNGALAIAFMSATNRYAGGMDQTFFVPLFSGVALYNLFFESREERLYDCYVKEAKGR